MERADMGICMQQRSVTLSERTVRGTQDVLIDLFLAFNVDETPSMLGAYAIKFDL